MHALVERKIYGRCGTRRAVFRFCAGRLVEWEFQELEFDGTPAHDELRIQIWEATIQWYRARDGEFPHKLPASISAEFPNALDVFVKA